VSQIYVYYKVSAEHRAAALEAAAHVLSIVEQQTGIAGTLSCRADDPLTLMESYPGITDAVAFRLDLDTAVAHSSLGEFLHGTRHTEHFVPCA